MFLGMNIESIGGNKVAVSTPHHVDDPLEDFGETLKVNVMSPDTSQLFTITSESKEFYGERKERYHLITA